MILTCEAARELAPDLALGTLAGQERAELLAHLAGCPSCEVLVLELAGVADTLLLLTPEIDPPAGFESAVLDRIRASAPAPARRRSLRTWALAAAAAIVLVAAAVGSTLAATSGRSGTSPTAYAGGDLRTAALIDARQHTWGQAFVFEGRSSWVFVTMRWDVPNGSYTLQLDRSDGPSLAVPGLEIVDGAGTIGHAVGETTDVTAIRVVDAGGRTICRATFPASHDIS